MWVFHFVSWRVSAQHTSTIERKLEGSFIYFLMSLYHFFFLNNRNQKDSYVRYRGDFMIMEVCREKGQTINLSAPFLMKQSLYKTLKVVNI